MAKVNKPCCIDIYHGNDVMDLPERPMYGLTTVKRNGIFALIHKSSEGSAARDQRYDARRERWMTGDLIDVVDTDGATKLKLSPLWGAYHFFHGVDPTNEAKNCLMTARLQTGDMAFIDWEAVGASGYQPSVEAADAFCQAVEDATGRPCGVYGGNVPRERFAAEKPATAVLERFAGRPLWFCAYGSVSLLRELPEPWKQVGAFLWQDDGDASGPGPHSMPGIRGNCDNSTVVDPMTFKELHSHWLGLPNEDKAPAPEAPPVAVAEVVPPPPPVPNVTPVPETFEDKIRKEVSEFEEHLREEFSNKPA